MAGGKARKLFQTFSIFDLRVSIELNFQTRLQSQIKNQNVENPETRRRHVASEAICRREPQASGKSVPAFTTPRLAHLRVNRKVKDEVWRPLGVARRLPSLPAE
jgi:hypothetical protein